MAPISRMTPRARNGIAAPIWSKALAHCGACHTPRNALGAERARARVRRRRRRQLACLRDQRPVAGAGAVGCRRTVPLSARRLASRPRRRARPDGSGCQQFVAVPESDVRAIATYMAGVFGAPTPDRKRRGDEVLARRSRPQRSSPAATPPAHRSTPRRARAAMPDDRPLPYGGINLGLSAPRSAVRMRATPPTSCSRASRRGRASAARSCRALPTA